MLNVPKAIHHFKHLTGIHDVNLLAFNYHKIMYNWGHQLIFVKGHIGNSESFCGPSKANVGTHYYLERKENVK